jgi:prepilin-type N-terminal cleavage/methylation domain-containing protein
MRPISHHKGFTLAEVLISTGILSLVLLGVYTLLNFAIKWHAKMGETVDVYQQAMRASTRLTSELGTGLQSSFIYDIDGQGIEGLAFASARPLSGPYKLDATGKVLWHRRILYYVENDTLFRNEVAINPPTATPLPSPDLITLRSQAPAQGQVMAENVSDLEISGGSGAAVRFKVSGKRAEPANSITIEGRVSFRQ